MNNYPALALFQRACEQYLRKDFMRAKAYIEQYKKLVNYKSFFITDQRTQQHVFATIIIVTCRRENEIFRCLDALQEQTDNDFEIIVVNNGAEKISLRSPTSYPLAWIDIPLNMYPSEGRNIGASFSRGQILVFLDDDGIPDTSYISEVRQAFSNPKILAIRGRIEAKEKTKQPLPWHYDYGPRPSHAVLNTEGNMAVRRGAFEEIGGFDALLFGHEGLEFTLRCSDRFQDKDFYYIPTVVLFHDFSIYSCIVAKRLRQKLAVEYLEALRPGIGKLIENKNFWYGTRFKAPPMSRSLFQNTTLPISGISIIIRVFHDPDKISKVLESFYTHNTYEHFEILVVASDWSRALVQIHKFLVQGFLFVLPLSSDSLLGPILTKTRFSHILFIDENVEFTDDALRALSKHAEKADMFWLKDQKGNLEIGISPTTEDGHGHYFFYAKHIMLHEVSASASAPELAAIMSKHMLNTNTS